MTQRATNGRVTPARAVAAETPQRNPWLVLVVLCTAVFMLLLDSTVVNVAQQKIKEGLNADLSQIQWVLDSYILTYAVLLLSFGRMGDVFGRKKLFILGMAIFTAASALCGASNWLGHQIGIAGATALILARVIQGVGGAFMMPQTLSLLTVVFPPEKRGAALGSWSGMVSLGAIIGPIIGGLIVTDYAWEWIFLINVPVGIAAIAAAIVIVPESVDPRASTRLDWGGLLLSGVGIFALVYALIEAATKGWTSPEIVALLAVSVALLTAFVWWEGRAADPMMKLELFRLRNFWVGNVIGGTVAFGMLGIMFPLTLFLQAALGFSPIRAGLTTAPMSVVIMFVAPFAGRMTDRIGARWLLFSGMGLSAVGIVLMIGGISLETSWLTLLPALLVTGAGMGLTFAPMTTAAMQEVPPRIAGSASGILNTIRQTGQVLGIAVLGSVLQSRLGTHAAALLSGLPLDAGTKADLVGLAKGSRFEVIAQHVPVADRAQLPAIFHALQLAFVDSLHNTFLVGAATCLLGAFVALMMRKPAPRPATAPAGATVEPEPVVAIAD